MPDEKILTLEPHAGERIEDFVLKMLRTAHREKQDVEATFNNTVFRVTPKMTSITEGEEAFRLAYEARTGKKQENTTTGIAAKIKDEKIDTQGHSNEWNKAVEMNSNDAFGRRVISYAEKWAKLMQIEMRNYNTDKLTPYIIEKTLLSGGTEVNYAVHLLISTWKHGEELGKIEGYSEEQIKEWRRPKETNNEESASQKIALTKGFSR